MFAQLKLLLKAFLFPRDDPRPRPLTVASARTPSYDGSSTAPPRDESSTSNSSMPEVTVRYAIVSDLLKLVVLERSVKQEEYWTEEEFRTVLTQRRFKVLAAEYKEDIIGYLAMRTEKSFNAIHTVVVRPDWQRKHLGTALVDIVKYGAESRLRDAVVCMVREKDLLAQLFLKANDFICMHVVDDAYEDPPESGYQFEWHRGESP